MQTVPKWVYDQLRTDYETLLEKYHALRPTHNAPATMRVIGPKPDSAQQAFVGGERAVVDPRIAEAALALVRQHGLPEADALREANRLFAIGTGKAPAPGLA